MLANGTLLQTRYLIKRLLAQGEAANIYEAEVAHPEPASVVIQETFSQPQETRKQFLQQAAQLARLRHRALPKVRDYFVEGDGRFLVTEFIPGQNLEEKLRAAGRPFDWRQVMDWADQLLDALEYLHAQHPPVLHRDIRPQNLRLTPNGDLYLVGFGLDNGAAVSSKPGIGVQSTSYLSPEQLKQAGTDGRSDLYSLGATFHRLLSGEIPDTAKVREEVIQYRVPDPLLSVHELNPQVSKPLADVILQTLALDRQSRYPSANALREVFRRLKEQQSLMAETQESERQLQSEEQRRLQQESAARKQRDAGQRRQEEERRFLAEQRRQEEEKRHRETRQRELAQQRKQAEERRRRQQQQRQEVEQRQLEEERIAEQKRLEQEQAETRRRQEETLRQESARQSSEQREREESERPVKVPVGKIAPADTASAPPSDQKHKSRGTAIRTPRVRWAAGIASVLIVLLVVWLWPQRGNRTASQSLPQVVSPLQPAVSVSPATPAPEQLQYWFEQFANGQSQTLTTHELTAEREFKLHFKPREDGYLYLLALDGNTGQLTAFLPGGARLGAEREFVFPNGQRIRGLADGEQLRFTVLFSRQPIERFDSLAEQAKSQPDAIKWLQTHLGAISPGSIEDFSTRGVPANVVSNQENHPPLIFDINLNFISH